MTAIISTTYDDKYLYFLPITTWLWSKLGVETICFMPYLNTSDENKRINLINDTFHKLGIKPQYAGFASPKHKEATYAQCSRLYGACLDLPEDEVLVLSDIDMGNFKVPPYLSGFTVLGNDLVPKGQFPMCYISAKVKDWRNAFQINGRTYQQCLDDLVGVIECEHFKGNQWSLDQDTAYRAINLNQGINTIPRSNGQNQFAQHRYDRDDSYILDRLNPDTIDFHMNRPGFQDGNFYIILTILKYHFPAEDFTWLINYTNEYKKLL